MAPPARDPQSRPLDETIDAAIHFLLQARTGTGWWIDYDGFREGASDEWVTAYVAHALAETRSPAGLRAAREAWDLLRARDRDGWGWNALQPCDADSTAWALRLASRLGEDGTPRAQSALTLLRSHLRSDGAVATYTREAHRAMGLDVPINPAWSGAHPDVTAVAAACRGIGADPVTFLRRSQHADGWWDSYWWDSAAYTTAHAVDHLVDLADLAEPDAAVERASRWARRQLERRETMSAFELALTLRTALARPEPAAEILRLGGRELCARQLPDGSWPASAALVIPGAAGDVKRAVDQDRTFTTATVLRALAVLAPVML